MRNEVPNPAICDSRENESRILGTASNESASVSVAQNDLALPEAWCSSTPAQATATRDSPFFVSAHGRVPYL